MKGWYIKLLLYCIVIRKYNVILPIVKTSETELVSLTWEEVYNFLCENLCM